MAPSLDDRAARQDITSTRWHLFLRIVRRLEEEETTPL